MNYILLLATAFLTSFGIGYAKFFGLTYLASTLYSVEDKKWIIQIIGSLMTIGPIIIYPLSAPLAAAMKKRYLMFGSSILTASFLTFGYLMNWPGTAWFYLFMIGLFMGVFSVAKMASVPLESMRSKKSIFSINAGLTIVFLTGMLSGIFVGTRMYEYDTQMGLFIGISIFVMAAMPAIFCKFPQEKVEPISRTFHELTVDTLSLVIKFPLYLLSSPLLWGVASAVSLAVTAYAEERGLGTASACSLINLYAAIGIIIGSISSTKLTTHRYIAASIAAGCMALFILGIPFLVETGIHYNLEMNTLYILLSLLVSTLASFFGLAANLIDAEFLDLVGAEGKEGTGAALQSIFLSIFSFLIGGSIALAILQNWIGATTQFVVLSAVAFIGVALILLLATINGAMNEAILKIIYLTTQFTLRLRYKITVIGLDKVDQEAGGMIVLPNHPAEVDPVILGLSFWKKARLRPVADEGFYHMPIINKGFKLVNTIPMPDLRSGAGYFKRLRIKKTMQHISQSLQSGDNILLYPSGHLTRTGREIIGGSSATAQLINEVPTAQIILVKTTGLWGSSFSTAQTAGATPDLFKSFKKALFSIAKNLIFFTPRRKVRVEITPVPHSYFKSKETADINATLENFYNETLEEPTLLPYSCWSAKKPEFQAQETPDHIADISTVSDDVNQHVREGLAEILQRDKNEITAKMRLSEDLSMDSIDTTEAMIWLEDEYDVSGLEVADLKTVADVMLLASGDTTTQKDDEAIKTPPAWDDLSPRPEVQSSDAETIAQAFLKTCDRMGNAVAMADDTSGVMTWNKLKISTLLMANIIRQYNGKHIGIMLPASVGASLITIATILAGKIPVMLNWTTGRKNLEHAAETTELDVVLTSGKFLDKLVQIDFGHLEDKLVFLEDMREQITLDKKLIAAFKSRNHASTLMKELELDGIQGKDTAVILFTSGSESSPKGVPLSHQNILRNISGALEAMTFKSDDVLYGFLPPFHSFGLTVTTMLPLTTGLKVAYYPNPTEGSRIATGCERWSVSLMAGTPSFINSILKSATIEQVKRIRVFIAGAEKVPQELFTTIENLGNGAEIVEGYGITECSPIISCNRPGLKKEGVGIPFTGTEVMIVNPDNHEPLSIGERGLILVNGPGVFSGYLNYPLNPFTEVNGKQWYNTGDLGTLSLDNYLTISGRMKRFVKIGGEMISLPAIEDALIKVWPANEDGPVIAVHAVEIEGVKPVLYLFTSLDINNDDANKVLKEAGFSALSKISQFKKMPQIPLLGTGKTDYQSLKKLM